MTSAVSGQQYQIGAGSYRATVTGLGAGLRELLFRDQPVIAGYDADELPPGAAGQLLAPWPNRIDGGRYLFHSAQFQLARLAQERGSSIPGSSALTAAELRVLPLLCTHLSFPEISQELFLSPLTVKSEMKAIYRKLGVSSRSQAVTRARELGLLEG